jgi:hypothetical protein
MYREALLGHGINYHRRRWGYVRTGERSSRAPRFKPGDRVRERSQLQAQIPKQASSFKPTSWVLTTAVSSNVAADARLYSSSMSLFWTG